MAILLCMLLSAILSVCQTQNVSSCTLEDPAVPKATCNGQAFDLSGLISPDSNRWELPSNQSVRDADVYTQPWGKGVLANFGCPQQVGSGQMVFAITTDGSSCYGYGLLSDVKWTYHDDGVNQSMYLNTTNIIGTTRESAIIVVCDPTVAKLTNPAQFTFLVNNNLKVVIQVPLAGACVQTATTTNPTTTTTSPTSTAGSTTTTAPSTTAGSTTSATSTTTGTGTTTSGSTTTSNTNDTTTTVTMTSTSSGTTPNSTTTESNSTTSPTSTTSGTPASSTSPEAYPTIRFPTGFNPCIVVDLSSFSLSIQSNGSSIAAHGSRGDTGLSFLPKPEVSSCYNSSDAGPPQAVFGLGIGQLVPLLEVAIIMNFEGQVTDDNVSSWNLASMDVTVTQSEDKGSALFNSSDNPSVWPVAPRGFGYQCNQNLTFTSSDGTSQLVISRFGAQPFNVVGTSISPAPDAGLDTCGSGSSTTPQSTSSGTAGSTTTPNGNATTTSGGSSTSGTPGSSTSGSTTGGPTTPPNEGDLLAYPATASVPQILVDFRSVTLATTANTYLFDRNTTFTVNDDGSSVSGMTASIEVGADFSFQPGQGLNDMSIVLTFEGKADKDGNAASWNLASVRSRASGPSVNVDVTTAVSDSPSSSSWPKASYGWGWVCDDTTVLQADDGTTALLFDGLVLQPFNLKAKVIQPKPGAPFDDCTTKSKSKKSKGTTVKAVAISLAVVAVLAVALFIYVRRRRSAYERITG
eukprot:m.206710 g.206710  ORF g.206710 m.206710 type:complete len:744 (-) comp17109_c0_seq1:2523-4754(-)